MINIQQWIKCIDKEADYIEIYIYICLFCEILLFFFTLIRLPIYLCRYLDEEIMLVFFFFWYRLMFLHKEICKFPQWLRSAVWKHVALKKQPNDYNYAEIGSVFILLRLIPFSLLNWSDAGFRQIICTLRQTKLRQSAITIRIMIKLPNHTGGTITIVICTI